MPAEKSHAEILKAMAHELDGSAGAAEERAKMHDRNAATQPTDARRQEHVLAAGRARDAATFYRRRQQALLDGARLLEASERSAA
ncbi:hypothetical protein [Caulobacter sp. 1776]|uniref:hypothetical protein n=1 Tax=Caulobacter sp. 1776 TaxID=3156420 RepID=UPI0033908494